MLLYHCCYRDKELAKVVVRKEDVDLIVSLYHKKCLQKYLVINHSMLEAQKIGGQLIDGTMYAHLYFHCAVVPLLNVLVEVF